MENITKATKLINQLQEIDNKIKEIENASLRSIDYGQLISVKLVCDKKEDKQDYVKEEEGRYGSGMFSFTLSSRGNDDNSNDKDTLIDYELQQDQLLKVLGVLVEPYVKKRVSIIRRLKKLGLVNN